VTVKISKNVAELLTQHADGFLIKILKNDKQIDKALWAALFTAGTSDKKVPLADRVRVKIRRRFLKEPNRKISYLRLYGGLVDDDLDTASIKSFGNNNWHVEDQQHQLKISLPNKLMLKKLLAFDCNASISDIDVFVMFLLLVLFSVVLTLHVYILRVDFDAISQGNCTIVGY